MVQTTENSRKLLSCSSNFSILKLIMLVGPLLFISINGDNGVKVHDAGRKGAGYEILFVPENTSTTPTSRTMAWLDDVADHVLSPNNTAIRGNAEGANIAAMTDHYNFIADERNQTTQNDERVLSRRRRYLVFPEGSSIQVVADTVVAVVDHQSQLVIGLTAAMAWELPFDPFYPEEELQEAYEEGRLPLLQIDFEQEDDDEDDDDDDDEDKKNKKQHRRKDNSTSIKYHSKKKSSKKPTQLPLPSELNPRPPSQYFNQPSPYVNYLQPMHSTNYYAGRPQQPHPYYTNYGSDKSPAFDGYYSSNNRIPTQSFLGYQPNSNKLNYYLSYADKLFREYKAQLNRSGSTSDAPNDRTPIAEKKNDDKKSGGDGSKERKPRIKTKPATTKFYDARKHFIHPAFKRSTAANAAEHWANISPMEKFDLVHHRRTRHTLYQRIEKFLDAQGNHGMDCILKLLCETGQRKDEKEPGSMVVELMRAIFTLPIVPDNTNNSLHRSFDEAHVTDKDCSQLFPRCKGSIWKRKFNG